MPVFAGIEAGGTKFVCAVGTAPHDLRARVEFLTTSPEDTLGRVEAFLQMLGRGVSAGRERPACDAARPPHQLEFAARAEVAGAQLDIWAQEHGYTKIELNLVGL